MYADRCDNSLLLIYSLTDFSLHKVAFFSFNRSDLWVLSHGLL